MSEEITKLYIILVVAYPLSTLTLGMLAYGYRKENQYLFLGFLSNLALFASLVPFAATFDIISIPADFGDAIGIAYFTTVGFLTVYLEVIIVRGLMRSGREPGDASDRKTHPKILKNQLNG